MTQMELIIALAMAMAVAQAIHELVRQTTSGEPSESQAQSDSRMHAAAEDQRQAAISELRDARLLAEHWTCPHCTTLVGIQQDACPACGGRLTLAVLKAQGWKRA